MNHRSRIHQFGAVFALLIALTLGVYAQGLWAADASITIFTGGSTRDCGGMPAAATFQVRTITLDVQGFRSNAASDVTIDVTFPDGRVLSFAATQRNPSVGSAPTYVDGVLDQPLNGPTAFPTGQGGGFSTPFFVDGDFPYGCYSVTARGSGKTAMARFIVLPGGQPGANPGLAGLHVSDGTTGDSSSQQGALVDIHGLGFMAGEFVAVWVTAPDGAVLAWPQTLTPTEAQNFITGSDGRFVATFEFSGVNPTGLYQFTALGQQSGYRVITPFRLTARPVVVRGPAALRVAAPADKGGQQRTFFQIQGERFNPYERVDVWATLPDESVRGLPSQYADQFGAFFADVALDETLPVGLYQFTAQGADSRSLVITAFRLEQAGGVAQNLEFQPEVINSNTGGETVGDATYITNNPYQGNAPGEQPPADVQDNPGPVQP